MWDTLRERIPYYTGPQALGATGADHGTTEKEKGLHLRYGRRDLPREPGLAGRAEICGVAGGGEEKLPVPHQLQPVHPQGAPAEAGPDGAGRGRVPLLHQRPGHGALPGQPGPGMQRLCGGRAWNHQRPL